MILLRDHRPRREPHAPSAPRPGRLHRTLLCLGALLTLAGCAPMEWRRGNEVATLESRDYQQCRNRATLEAMRLMPSPFLSPYPVFPVDRPGRHGISRRTWSYADYVHFEHLRMMDCLTGLGYQLQPITPDPGAAPTKKPD